MSVPFLVDSGAKCFGCGTRNPGMPGLHPTLITSWNWSGHVKFYPKGCDYDWPTGPSCSKVDSTIHWINHYPLDNTIDFDSTYPLDCDLCGG